MSSGQLDRARQVLEGLLREKNEGITRLFELCDFTWCWGKTARPWKSYRP